jgi:hypothetical protein
VTAFAYSYSGQVSFPIYFLIKVIKMRLIFVCCLLFAMSISFAQQSREEKLQQLKTRTDIKVTEVEKDIIKLEYPHGKVLYKNIGDYRPDAERIISYSPTFDSTIIDLTTIDTTLYYHKYSFWQEVPLSNADFDYLRIGDINNNGKPELYGLRKYFESGFEPITVYELNKSGLFQEIYQYDTVIVAVNIYDVNNDGWPEVHLTTSGWFGPPQQRFFSKPTDTSLATELNITFSPYPEQFPTLYNQTLGDFDKDGYTDLLFSRASTPYVYIFEYNPFINNFDSVYRFEAMDGKGGFSVGDFDLDGKTDIVFATINGSVYVLENEGDNQYTNSWQGMVETYNAYRHTWTNDTDKNGKPEFWVMGNAFYGNDAITRITIFETDGDNSYHSVGRIDLIGVFPFYAGNMQAIDIDGDGTEEVAICIDENFLILKFNGSKDHHTYEVFYIKKNELNTENEYQVYFGATMNDLQSDGKQEILISMRHIIEGQTTVGRDVTKIYKPDSTTSVVDEIIMPAQINLNQNYPNPFNPSTSVRFEINLLSNISIKIYNVLGKEITTLLEKQISPGSYTIDWEARDSNGKLLPSGVYFIRLSANNKAGNYTQTIKAMLIK